MLSILRNKFVIGGIVIVILFGVWYAFTSSSEPASVLTSSAPASADDEQIVTTLIQLQTITLSGTIFSDPAFQSLQDDTTAITPEPVGRDDPFASIGSNAPVTGSSQTAQIFQTGK